MPVLKDEAVMLRSYPFGEGGQIVSFLTREHGKLRGHARSSRRLKSRFGSSLEPFSRVDVIYFQKEGRDLVTLDHTDLIASPYVRGARDLSVAWHVQYMTELIELVAQEGEPEPLLYRLISSVGDAVEDGGDIEAITLYFEIWLLRLQGVLPDLTECGNCGVELTESAVFDIPRDLVLCRECGHPGGERAALDRPVLRLLLECLRRPVTEILTAGVSRDTVWEASTTLRCLLRRYIGREIRSLRFLQTLRELPE